MNITTEQVRLTPNLASDFLKSNKGNRQVSERTVHLYASAIRRGEWVMNGEAIVFDRSGRLVNGQHRCHAVIASDTPIDVLVVRGVAPDAFATYDRGKQRKVGDVFSIAGEQNATRLASACRAYLHVKNKMYGRDTFTPTQAIETLEKTPALRFWCNQFVNRRSVRSVFTSALAGVLCAASEKYGDDALILFLDQLDSGVGLSAGSPALLLRDKFMDRTARQGFTSSYSLALYIKAVNAHVQGKTLGVLRFKSNESYPELA